MIPTSEIEIIQFCTLGCDTTAGKKGSEKRTNPYVPIFSSTPARMTDPAVGASTCASGSQVWTGHIGTFTAKDASSAKNSHDCISTGKCVSIRTPMSVVPACSHMAISASSINTEPVSVNRKNFTA